MSLHSRFRFRDFCRDEAGVTALEFSLVAPMFFAVVVAVLMLGALEMGRAQLDQAAEVAKRGILTGQVKDLTTLKTNIRSAIGGIIDPDQVMVSLASYKSLSNLNTATPTLTYDNDGNLTNNWTADFGESGSIMVLQLVYQMPVVSAVYSYIDQTNGGNYELVATQVFTRE